MIDKTMLTASFLVTLILQMTQVLSTHDPCEHASTPLPEVERRGRNFTLSDLNEGPLPLVTDRYLLEGWYSANAFGVPGKQYLMTDTSAQLQFGHCGTYYPVYMNEPHPVLEDGTLTTVSTCTISFSDPCEEPFDVKVRRCGGKYEYNLRSVEANSAFCFDNIDIDDPDSASPPFSQLGVAQVEVALQYSVYTSNGNQVLSPFLEFYCTFPVNDNLVYFVDWYVNLERIYRTGPIEQNVKHSTALSESTLIDKGYSLGISIICGYSAARNMTSVMSHRKYSPEFFAGIKVHVGNQTIKAGGNARIIMENTVPIGCEMSGQPDTSDRCGVDVLTLDTARAGNQCSATTLTSLSSLGICGTHVPAFRYTSWLDLNSNTANICQSPTCRELQFFNFSLTLGIRNDVQNDIIPYVPSVFLLQVRTGNTGHRLWRDYDVANLSVVVENDNPWPKNWSVIFEDGTETTIDGRTYTYMFQDPGPFVLYRHKEYPIEVQAKLEYCNETSYCICSVVIRVGGAVFTIDSCDGATFVGFRTCSENVIEYRSARGHEILTPIGTRLSVSVYKSQYYSVTFELATKDFNNVEGLCGNFDGLPENDFEGHDTEGFVSNSRVSTDYSDNSTYDNLTCWPDQVYCSCSLPDTTSTTEDVSQTRSVCSLWDRRDCETVMADNCTSVSQSGWCSRSKREPLSTRVSTCHQYTDLGNGLLHYQVQPGKCYIDNTCRNVGDRNTVDSCLVCSQDSPTDWTISANSCYINGACVTDGNSNTDTPCRHCDVTESQYDWSTEESSCYIDEECYIDGELHVDDSCFQCAISESQTSWHLMAGYCYIQDRCRAEGVTNTTEACLTCDPSYSTDTWTDKCTTTEEPQSLDEEATSTVHWIIIGSAIGGFVLILSVIGVIIVRHRRRKINSDIGGMDNYLENYDTLQQRSIKNKYESTNLSIKQKVNQDDPMYESVKDDDVTGHNYLDGRSTGQYEDITEYDYIPEPAVMDDDYLHPTNKRESHTN